MQKQKNYLAKRVQTIGEEIGNSITHGIGLLCSVVGLIVLFVHALSVGNVWYKLSLLLYGVTLVFMYLSSTLYHGFRNERLKKFFHKLDHMAIYLLIAGTYAPITLIFLPSTWGFPLFFVVWGMAVCGVLFKIFCMGKMRRMSVVFYLLMGWAAIVAIKPMLSTFPKELLLWILVGGLFYTVGIVFYAWKKIAFHHVIWHLFVLGGSVAHFIGIFRHLKAI